VAVSFGMTGYLRCVCVTFAPTALLPPGVVLSIRNIRAVNNPADSLPAIGILAALGAFGGVLNKFPALTTSGSSTCFVVTASAGHQSMEVVILTDWREQFLRPYRMGRLTRCSMGSRNFHGDSSGAEPDRTLATVLFTDVVDSRKQAASENGVNCCSNTTSLCEGSWRGSVAGRRTRRGMVS